MHPLVYKHPITGLQTMCFHTGNALCQHRHLYLDSAVAQKRSWHRMWQHPDTVMLAGMIDTFMWDKGTSQQRMATPLETVQILDEIDR